MSTGVTASNRQIKLRHIAIVTLNPDRLARFYIEVFGMKEIHRVEAGPVFVSDGTITLALLSNKAEGKPTGLNHLGFHVDDRDEIAQKLADWGLSPPAQRPADRPYAEVRITDPDGNNIDLSLHGFDKVEPRGG